ncbi:hypothetical protein RDWZM_001070 [Blomia tropicalis]|uniref:Transmembrane protein n=1 Tax=Blomia tropicalis TaxID=40697 RepID=A0A9Q0MAX6_BLOTA|nr:hypothetical protein BLOT_006906 [Blomia tropicalis]KAJ6222525.1 hypothetical protein RDWZM_001070 [Blomia tropicalis]
MGIGQSKELDTSQLKSFWDVIAINHEPINTFVEIWYHVFLWSLFSSVIVHIIPSMVAFNSLRRHKIARYGPIIILLSSIITPLLSYSITSAVIACVYRTASFVMFPIYAMFWGCGLTLITTIFSFSRVLATL